MHHQDGQRTEKFHAVIPVGNPIQTVQTDGIKSKSFCLHPAIRRISGARKGAAPNRGYVGPLIHIFQTIQIPQVHHGIRHQMMSEGNRLSPLQMGVPRHYGLLVFLCLVGQRFHHFQHQLLQLFNLFLYVHPKVQSHLIVSAPCGVEHLSLRADAFGQFPFDEHVHVLGGQIHFQLPALQILQDSFQPFDNVILGRSRNDALCRQHLCMHYRSGDVLSVQSLIKRNRRIEFIGNFVQLSGSAAGPHFLHIIYLLKSITCCSSDSPLPAR